MVILRPSRRVMLRALAVMVGAAAVAVPASAAAGTVADGTGVTIACQTPGTTVDGTYGTSNIWDRIGAGRYIADANVLTGYLPGVPRC